MAKSTAARWVTIRWQALWQLWLGIAVALYGWRQVAGWLPATWVEAGYVLGALTSSSLLLALLALLLKPEPLAVHVDYRAGRATCYRPGLPWRISLPLHQLRCQLSEQSSHNGKTHFLVVSGARGQVWAIQESSEWPLARLQRLHELLTFDNP
jgi:hypothetical protein